MSDAEEEISKAELAIARASNSQETSLAQADFLAGRRWKADEERIRNIWAGYMTSAWLGAGVEACLMTPSPPVVPSGSDQFVLGVPRAGRWSASSRAF